MFQNINNSEHKLLSFQQLKQISYYQQFQYVTMSDSFRFNQMVEFTFANTDWMKQKKINNMFSDMQASMQIMKQVDDTEKSQKQRVYMKAFISVMERMNEDLLQVRNQYNGIDKEMLKLDKCEKYAEDISIFRQECYLLRQRLQREQEIKNKEKLREDLLDREIQALTINIQKAEKEKKRDKRQIKKLLKEQQPKQNQSTYRFSNTNHIKQNIRYNIEQKHKNRPKSSCGI